MTQKKREEIKRFYPDRIWERVIDELRPDMAEEQNIGETTVNHRRIHIDDTMTYFIEGSYSNYGWSSFNELKQTFIDVSSANYDSLIIPEL